MDLTDRRSRKGSSNLPNGTAEQGGNHLLDDRKKVAPSIKIEHILSEMWLLQP